MIQTSLVLQLNMIIKIFLHSFKIEILFLRVFWYKYGWFGEGGFIIWVLDFLPVIGVCVCVGNIDRERRCEMKVLKIDR